MLTETNIRKEKSKAVLAQIREVMKTDHKTFMYHIPLPTRDNVYVRYPLEDKDNGALYAAHQKYRKVMKQPRNQLSKEIQQDITQNIKGILPGFPDNENSAWEIH
jgi:hypothetical protein